MAKALQRILRIRQLAEEQARLEVERAAQRARQASAACARQVAREHEQRNTLAESWTRGRHDDQQTCNVRSAQQMIATKLGKIMAG